jgi:hypothetical protein
LHAALFQRALGIVSPRRFEVCDLTFVRILCHARTSATRRPAQVAIQDADVTTEVEERADALARAVDAKGRARIRLSFYEKARPPKQRAPTSWFAAATGVGATSNRDEAWERWTLDIVSAPALTERERNRIGTVTKVRRRRLSSSRYGLSRCTVPARCFPARRPPLHQRQPRSYPVRSSSFRCTPTHSPRSAITKDGNPFPYEIVVNPDAREDEGWAGGLRRMLTDPVM